MLLKSFSNSFLCLNVIESLEIICRKFYLEYSFEYIFFFPMLPFQNLWIFPLTFKITLINMTLKQMSKNTFVLWRI